MSQSHLSPLGQALFEEAWAAMQGIFPAGASALSRIGLRPKSNNKCDRKGHIWNPVLCGGFEFTDKGRVNAQRMGVFACRRCKQHDTRPFRRADSNNPPINSKPLPSRRNR